MRRKISILLHSIALYVHTRVSYVRVWWFAAAVVASVLVFRKIPSNSVKFHHYYHYHCSKIHTHETRSTTRRRTNGNGLKIARGKKRPRLSYPKYTLRERVRTAGAARGVFYDIVNGLSTAIGRRLSERLARANYAVTKLFFSV